MSQYSHLSEVDPELAAVLPFLPLEPEGFLTIDERRAGLDAHIKNSIAPSLHRLSHSSHRTQYDVQEHQVPVDGGEITVRCVVPTPTGDEGKSFPVLVWFHGGGSPLRYNYVRLNVRLEMDDSILKIISVDAQLVTVNVDYRLAPEHKFPTSTHDSYAAVKWAAEHTSLLHVDLSKGFVVGGPSSGANIATVIAHKAANDDCFATRKLTGQILGMPHVTNALDVPEE
ncbi:Alpha/Beta hydrolase protein [Amylocystis lapponica]|nr:Alpha/Beta hydrolase protein [Amylocystis lapponica]